MRTTFQDELRSQSRQHIADGTATMPQNRFARKQIADEVEAEACSIEKRRLAEKEMRTMARVNLFHAPAESVAVSGHQIGFHEHSGAFRRSSAG